MAAPLPPKPSPGPSLVGDFGLVPVNERLEWRYGFARHILAALDLPEWKREEAVRPTAATIDALVRQGQVNPVQIQRQILEAARRFECTDNMSREHASRE